MADRIRFQATVEWTPRTLLYTLQYLNPSTGGTADRPAPAILDTKVEATGIKVFKVGKEGRFAVTLADDSVSEGAGGEKFAKSVAKIAKDDEDGIS